MQKSNIEYEIDTNDIKSLIDQLSTVVITNPAEKMATPNQTQSAASNRPIITEKELIFLINLLPEFNPGENLAYFINRVEELANAIDLNEANALPSYMLTHGIKSKLKGDAANFVAYFNCNTWSEIKNVLISKYGDRRSEQVLLNELDSLSQKSNESVQDFYHRIISAQNNLNQKIKLDTPDPALFKLKMDMYSERAVNTFRLGVTEPYCSYLDKFSLTTLEECLNKCITYDNEKSIKDYHEYMRRKASENQKPKFAQKPPNPFAFKPSNFQFGPPRNNYQNFNNNSRPQNFSSPKVPFPNKQFSAQPQRFPTNKQVFGNAAKPIGSTMSQLQNRPTPMSVASKSHGRIFPNYQQQKPNFISQELFNCETDEQIDYELAETIDYQPDYEQYEENFVEPEENVNFREEASETEQHQQ